MKAIIGKSGLEKIGLDLPTLLRTRMLVQANSGGGKSYALRKILEETHGKVQQIILDMEGEFLTLRERYDYIIVGKDGDIPINIQSAELLAKKILETGVSFIIDLYELKQHERILFVKRFLDSMVNAPKELWHSCLVVLDEAHVFAPEKSKSESLGSVIDMATRGRKRGFALIAATQRLSKLHKDTAAELNNKLIGRTGLDVDMKRASEELGFASKSQMLELRTLKAGEFFAFGPAISDTIKKVKIGRVKTSHPEVGGGVIVKPAPATDKLKKVLAKLTDLPEEARKELNNVQDLKAELRKVRMEVRRPPIDQNRMNAEIEKAVKIESIRMKREKEFEINNLNKTNKQLQQKLHSISLKISDISKIVGVEIKLPKVSIKPWDHKTGDIYTNKAVTEIKENISTNPLLEAFNGIGISTDPNALKSGHLKILKAISMYYPQGRTKKQVALLTGYSVKGGGFQNYLSKLKTMGLITYSGDVLYITEEGVNQAGEVEELSTDPNIILNMWLSKLKTGPAKILKVVFDVHPGEISKEEIAVQTNYSPGGGGFNNYISYLRSNNLIVTNGDMVKASNELFPED
ncbi:DUF87 domain-containing protein [Candidatus Woesearchaeota archaeon]|nr:DUF87 domain-containing protein [Candidatus Woesearchaeota archaeon]